MTKLHFKWDTWGFLLIFGDPKSWRDAIGRLMEYLYAHGKLNEVNPALESCLDLTPTGYVLYRHPTFLLKAMSTPGSVTPDPTIYKYDKKGEEFASRDHWSYFIQYKKNTLSEEEFTDFISKVPRMRGMNLWMKTMKGSKWAEWWFYALFNPGAYLGNIASNLITWIGRLGPEMGIHWWIVHNVGEDVNRGTRMLYNLTWWQKAWRKIWVTVTPFYPIQNRGWQLKWLPESKRKERQKRILLRRTDKDNPIVRLLFGDLTVSISDVRAYPETTGDASGIKLNKSCDRTIRRIPMESQQGCYKYMLARTLFADLNEI